MNVTSLNLNDFLALDVIDVGILMFDTEEEVSLSNPAILKLFPSLHSQNELQGMGHQEFWMRLIKAGDIAGRKVSFETKKWLAEQHKLFGAGKPQELRLTNGDWLEWSSERISSGYVVNSFKDITSVKFNQIRLEDALDSTNDGFALWGPEEELVYYNHEFEQLLIDLGLTTFIGETQATILQHLQKSGKFTFSEIDNNLGPFKVAESYHIINRTVAKHSDGRYFLVTTRRMGDGGAVTVLSDVTELKQKENLLVRRGEEIARMFSEVEFSKSKLEEHACDLAEALEQLDLAKSEAEQDNQAKTNFLAHMGHEIRTPLNAIIGFSETLNMGIFGEIQNAKQAEYVKDIYGSGKYLSELIADLLDISRIERGQLVSLEAKADVKKAVEESVKLVRTEYPAIQIVVTEDMTGEPLFLNIDPRHLKQIIINILKNAAAYSPRDSIVKISLQQEDGVQLRIIDEGRGMTGAEIEKVFMAYARLEHSAETRPEGLGIGLPLSKSLAENYGGEIHVESTPGKGSVFSIVFPSSCVVP